MYMGVRFSLGDKNVNLHLHPTHVYPHRFVIPVLHTSYIAESLLMNKSTCHNGIHYSFKTNQDASKMVGNDRIMSLGRGAHHRSGTWVLDAPANEMANKGTAEESLTYRNMCIVARGPPADCPHLKFSQTK